MNGMKRTYKMNEKREMEWHENEMNKMQPRNPNAHTYVNGTDVETHGYAVTQNTFLKQFIWTVLYMFPLLSYQCTVDCGIWKKVACKVWSVKCKV